MADPPDAAPAPTPTEVVEHFDSPADARAAMLRLEKAGIDGDRISLRPQGDTVPSPQGMRQADAAALGDAASSAGAGAGVGAIVGAAAGIVTGLVTGDVATGATIGAAATTAGGVAGGLTGTYKGLPANPEAFETYELDPDASGPIAVAVRVDDPDQADAARAALNS